VVAAVLRDRVRGGYYFECGRIEVVEFILNYRGHLKANGDSKHKHCLRRHFHEQLKELWNQPPLNKHRGLLDPGEPMGPDVVRTLDSESSTLVQTVGPYEFASVVSSKINLVADLDITLLRPGPPGAIVSHGGDLDNRLKTLFDALKIPDTPDAVPTDDSPLEMEYPFFCYLRTIAR
jgi:hypothetical protein